MRWTCWLPTIKSCWFESRSHPVPRSEENLLLVLEVVEDGGADRFGFGQDLLTLVQLPARTLQRFGVFKQPETLKSGFPFQTFD